MIFPLQALRLLLEHFLKLIFSLYICIFTVFLLNCFSFLNHNLPRCQFFDIISYRILFLTLRRFYFILFFLLGSSFNNFVFIFTSKHVFLVSRFHSPSSLTSLCVYVLLLRINNALQTYKYFSIADITYSFFNNQQISRQEGRESLK
jgi:hypothetical protein